MRRNTDDPPHAGVHVPPPILYAIAFFAGYLLHRSHPAVLTMSTRGQALLEAIGLGLIVLWAFVAGMAMTQFFRARTSIIPNRPASALVTGGAYRFTRNPMYVSLIILYIGLALLLNSWWPLALLPIVVVVIDRFVIAREERYLSAAFPDDYAAYRRRVRRWL